MARPPLSDPESVPSHKEVALEEITIRVDAPIAGPGKDPITAHVRGRAARDGRWEGWIEFVSVTGTPVLRTPVQAEARTREELVRWAFGLRAADLAEALSASLSPPPPADDGERPDPFEIFRSGESALREALSELEATALRQILRDGDPARHEGLDLRGLRHGVLVELVVAMVRRREAPPPDPLPDAR